MKKTLVALAATALMGGGLVGVSAEAAHATCPYTGCVDTQTDVSLGDNPVKKGHKQTICIKVTTGGEGKPKGRVGVGVVRSRGGFKFVDSKRYDGRTCFTTPELTKTGKYVVRANFEGRGAFKDSDNSASFTVTKRG